MVSTEKLLSHGDGTTVSQGLFPWGEKSQPHMVGASQRLLVDFSNENFFYFVLCGGQNGSPFSKNYKDQFQLWAKGEYLQIPWNERDKSICQEIFLHPKKK